MFQYLWAKSNPYKQLIAHMVDAGCCARSFLSAASSACLREELSVQMNLTEKDAIAFAAYLCALHDIGKAIPYFQKQNEEYYQRLIESGIDDEKRGKDIHHEYASSAIMYKIWVSCGEDEDKAMDYGRVLSLHHQRPETGNRYKGKNQQWMKMQLELEREIFQVFNPPKQLPSTNNMSSLCFLLTGILILSDWIASSGPFDDLPEYNHEYAFLSDACAKKAIVSYGLVSDHLFAEISGFHSMWPDIKQPRALQRACEKLDSSAMLTIIEAPMGEGKTEAALYLAGTQCNAYQKRGMYIALPTQATSNQMFERFEHMLQQLETENHPRLLHGMSFLQEENDPAENGNATEAQKWLRPLRMGMLEENAVGTVDQSMSSVLRSKFSVLRLLGLAEKVLIIDELHAYDAYMSEIISTLLKWCKAVHIPVILLSATLQSSQRKKYLSCYLSEKPILSEAYPLITQLTEDGVLTETACEATLQTTYHFKPVSMSSAEEIIRLALEEVSEGGCLCLLANTVKTAQEWYLCLKKMATDDVCILLFHARFPYFRRKAIEEECLKLFGRGENACRPKKAILISTQVVEQSLDIDFDGMITELAPVDLLLQRAGRVHRHRERTRPEMLSVPCIHVLLPCSNASSEAEKRYGSSGYVYAPFLLMNTEKLLKKGIDVDVPSQVRSVIADVYDQVSPEAEEAWAALSFGETLMGQQAKAAELPPPTKEEFCLRVAPMDHDLPDLDDGYESFAHASTRLGDAGIRIAFCTPELSEQVKENDRNPQIIREVFLRSVSLRIHETNIGP